MFVLSRFTLVPGRNFFLLQLKSNARRVLISRALTVNRDHTLPRLPGTRYKTV